MNLHRDTKHIVHILLLVVLAVATVELFSRYLVPRVSKIEGEISGELAEARAFGNAAGSRPSLLIFGNSLLDASTQATTLETVLGAPWQVRRLVIYNSSYYDLLFGISGLFARGAHPDVVVVMLSTNQLISDGVLGPYSAYHLFTATDSLEAGRRSNLHRTEIAGMLVGHYSAYYGLKEHVRKFSLRLIVPDAAGLAPLLSSDARPPPSSMAQIENIVRPRLKEISSLCASLATRCLFVLAPRPVPADRRDAAVMSVGQSLGLGTRSLYSANRWTAEDFQGDRFHMNKAGRGRFTQEFGALLRDHIRKNPSEEASKLQPSGTGSE